MPKEQKVYERFVSIVDILSHETLINEFYNFLSQDERKQFVEMIEASYEIESEDSSQVDYDDWDEFDHDSIIEEANDSDSTYIDKHLCY